MARAGKASLIDWLCGVLGVLNYIGALSSRRHFSKHILPLKSYLPLLPFESPVAKVIRKTFQQAAAFLDSPQMSLSVESAQSQWLTQLATMREAIAELKLDQASRNGQAYGHDIAVDDDDLTGSSGSDDIWDILSGQEDDDYSSDNLEVAEQDSLSGYGDAHSYNQIWLRTKCVALASRGSALDSGELEEQILALLASDSRGQIPSLF